MKGFVAALLAAAFVALVGPAAHAITIPPTQEETTTSRMSGVVRKLLIDSDSGDVTVRPGRRTTVTRTEHWVYQRPSVRLTFHNGTLTVINRCPDAPLNNCWTDITADIAPTAVVQTYTASGVMRVSGIRSPKVHALSSNGRVLLSDVAADDVKASTSNGDVKVNLTSAPALTSLRTSNGEIDAIVPRGTYSLDVRVGNGDVRVRGVSNRRNSAHKLSAATNNGDISITGR
jgi:hypothetical protein